MSLILSMDGRGVLETSAVDNPQTQPWNSSVLMQLLPMLWWCQRRNLHTPQRNGNRNRHGRTFEVCVKYQLFSAQPSLPKNLFEKTLIKTSAVTWSWLPEIACVEFDINSNMNKILEPPHPTQVSGDVLDCSSVPFHWCWLPSLEVTVRSWK